MMFDGGPSMETLREEGSLRPESTESHWTSSLLQTASLQFTTSPFRYSPPLRESLIPERIGAALLITSACRDFEEPLFAEVEGDSQSRHLVVLGGVYRHESRKNYRDLSLMGAALMQRALLDAGVPERRIKHLDYDDISQDYDEAYLDEMDPVEDIISILSRVPSLFSDVLVYYCGPTTPQGDWALAWHNADDDLKKAVIGPEQIFPSDGSAPAGNRFIIADAPYTKQWIQPALQRRGLAAWSDAGKPGGHEGPPLTRWLTGCAAQKPQGVISYPTPPADVGLRKLPAYEPLYWGPRPSARGPPAASKAAELLWELEEFLGAPTQRLVKAAAHLEVLVYGGVDLLVALLYAHGAACEEKLLLQIFWLLHSLVLQAEYERWVGTMPTVLQAVLVVLISRQNLCTDAIYTAGLSLTGACAARCIRCREDCAGDEFRQVLQLLEEVLDPRCGRDATAAAAACRLASQVCSHRNLDPEEHEVLLAWLQHALTSASPEEALLATGDPERAAAEADLQAAAAEVLTYACMRAGSVKAAILKGLGSTGELADALERAESIPASKLLALLRALSATEDGEQLFEALQGVTMATVVVGCLQRHAGEAPVQRWGFASLGALARADERFVEGIADGGSNCALRALLSFKGRPPIEQEALFCEHALLKSGHLRLEHDAQVQLARLAAGTVSDSARIAAMQGGSLGATGGGEVSAWGLEVLRHLANNRAGLQIVEPYVTVVVQALLTPSLPFGTFVAGSGIVSLLVGGPALSSPSVVAFLKGQRVKLTQALQAKAWGFGEAEGRPCGKEIELLEWCRVVVELLGDHKPSNDEDDFAAKEEEFAADAEDQEGSRLPSKF